VKSPESRKVELVEVMVPKPVTDVVTEKHKALQTISIGIAPTQFRLRARIFSILVT
jgi:hypothetical protein